MTFIIGSWALVKRPLLVVVMTTSCRAATPKYRVKQGARATLPSTPAAPAAHHELVMKTKTNGWPDPSSIQPAQLACLPLPKGAKYMAVKMAVVNIADPLEYPEEMTSYAHLWAGFTRRITIPKMFIHTQGGKSAISLYSIS
jgi:hypothetical protein